MWIFSSPFCLVSLPFALVYISSPCASLLFLLPLSLAPSLSVYLVGVPSFSVWWLTACGALISHMGQIRVQCVCMCVCIHMHTHTHLCHVFPGLDVVLWFVIVWTANPIAFSLTDLHGTKITYEFLASFNIDHTPWLSISKYQCRTDVINKTVILFQSKRMK